MSRPKGSPNRATLAAREAIGRFVDGNAARVEGWLDEIYERDGPLAAYRCWLDLVEYHVPKLARTEISGDPNNPVKTSLEVTFK
jgi:hypothetical protein